MKKTYFLFILLCIFLHQAHALDSFENTSLSQIQVYIIDETEPVFERMIIDAERVQQYILETGALPPTKQISFKNNNYQVYNSTLTNQTNGYVIFAEYNSGTLTGIKLLISFNAASTLKLSDTTSYKCYTNVDKITITKQPVRHTNDKSLILPECFLVNESFFKRVNNI